MKHLDKSDTARRLELVDQLAAADNVLAAALETYNATVADAWSPVQSAIDAYNAVIDDANGFRDDVANQIEEYIDNKSESWLAGERGQSYNEWLTAWQGSYLESIDLEQPAPIEIEEGSNPSDELRDLEEEVAA